MVYVPDPNDITNPTDSVAAETAQAEFRALKGKLQSLTGLIATINPTDISAGVVLTGGNLVAVDQGNTVIYRSGRANMGMFGSNFYYEVTLTSVSDVVLLGISQLSSPFVQNNQLGFYGVDYAYNCNTGVKVNNNTSTAFAASAVTGDVIGINYNGLNGSLTIYKNGVSLGVAFTGLDVTKTWYPAFSFKGIGDTLTMNFGGQAYAFGVAGLQSLTTTTSIVSGVRNIVYNGRMEVDAEHAGALVANIASGGYAIDGMKYIATQTNKFNSQYQLNNVNPPPYQTSYIGLVSNSAYAVLATDAFIISHMIEGWAIRHLDFGKATARPLTLSFWVYSSATGLHSGSLQNGAGNRSYVFQYLISTANTWTQVSIVIPGDVAGVWATNNALAMLIRFNLGAGANFLGAPNSWSANNFVGANGSVSLVGINGAVWYITGIELKDGIYSVGQIAERDTLQQAMFAMWRYYVKRSVLVSTSPAQTWFELPVPMRVQPAISGGGAGFGSNVDVTHNQLMNCTQTASATQVLVIDARM